MELCIEYLFIRLFISINFRSDECGRIFCYRKNGTRFHKDHVQVKDGSGRKTVPVWACFSAYGPGNFVRINGRLNSVKYIEILENYLLSTIRQRFPGRRIKNLFKICRRFTLLARSEPGSTPTLKLNCCLCRLKVRISIQSRTSEVTS